MHLMEFNSPTTKKVYLKTYLKHVVSYINEIKFYNSFCIYFLYIELLKRFILFSFSFGCSNYVMLDAYSGKNKFHYR